MRQHPDSVKNDFQTRARHGARFMSYRDCKMGGIKMARYGMLINIDRCNGCYNCYMACRDEFVGNDYPPYSAAQPVEGKSWMKVIEKERGSKPKGKGDYIAIPCQQSSDPPCVNKSS